MHLYLDLVCVFLHLQFSKVAGVQAVTLLLFLASKLSAGFVYLKACGIRDPFLDKQKRVGNWKGI